MEITAIIILAVFYITNLVGLLILANRIEKIEIKLDKD